MHEISRRVQDVSSQCESRLTWLALRGLVVAASLNRVAAVLRILLLSSGVYTCCRDVLMQRLQHIGRISTSPVDSEWRHLALVTLRDLIRQERDLEAALLSANANAR